MERKLIPLPPKFLVIGLGILSFISLLAVLFGHYGHIIVAEAGNITHKVTVSFDEENKLKANTLFEDLKSEGFNPELISTTSYTTEKRGYIVVVNYEGKDGKYLADKTCKILEYNGFKGSVFTPETNLNLVKVIVGEILPDEKKARNYAQQVFDKSKVEVAVEVYEVVTGKEKIFMVVLTTKDPFRAEDYKQELIQKGYSPEVTESTDKDK